jgi:hypothetical protein
MEGGSFAAALECEQTAVAGAAALHGAFAPLRMTHTEFVHTFQAVVCISHNADSSRAAKKLPLSSTEQIA